MHTKLGLYPLNTLTMFTRLTLLVVGLLTTSGLAFATSNSDAQDAHDSGSTDLELSNDLNSALHFSGDDEDSHGEAHLSNDLMIYGDSQDSSSHSSLTSTTDSSASTSGSTSSSDSDSNSEDADEENDSSVEAEVTVDAAISVESSQEENEENEGEDDFLGLGDLFDDEDDSEEDEDSLLEELGL